MNYNLVVEYKQSDKTGKYYYCLSLDLGCRTVALSFEPADIAEILGVSLREISILRTVVFPALFQYKYNG